MANKRILSISIAVVIAIILLVSGGTYAYYMAVTNEENVNSESGLLDINYTAPDANSLTGEIISSDDRTNGLHTTASASLKAGSEATSFNMYIKPTVLTGLDIAAFKWEVDAVQNGTTVETYSGTFAGAVAGTPIKIVDAFPLSTTNTTFNIYIWLNSSEVSSAIRDAAFKAEISADTVNITGQF